MSYEQFLSLFLTAMGILLALLTVAIGIIGFWGYNAFKDFNRKIRANLIESNTKRQAAEDRLSEIDSLIERKISEALERKKIRSDSEIAEEATLDSQYSE